MTWPTRKETTISTGMVLLMVAVPRSSFWSWMNCCAPVRWSLPRPVGPESAWTHGGTSSTSTRLRAQGRGIDRGAGQAGRYVGPIRQIMVPMEEVVEVRRGRR